MGYPTIERFDIEFIKRTKSNVEEFDDGNKFTHLINSLLGLIFIPNEFHKKQKRTYTIDFLNQKISEYEILKNIFSGEIILTNEQGITFNQKKFYYKNREQLKTIDETTIGDLVRFFRNGIAHSNIIPVSEGQYWKGIIVRNFTSFEKEKNNDFNFEVFLNQKEVRLFATLIADLYINNIN